MMDTNSLILNIQLINNNIIYKKAFDIRKVGYFDVIYLGCYSYHSWRLCTRNAGNMIMTKQYSYRNIKDN